MASADDSTMAASREVASKSALAFAIIWLMSWANEATSGGPVTVIGPVSVCVIAARTPPLSSAIGRAIRR